MSHHPFIETIVSEDSALRDRSIEDLTRGLDLEGLREAAGELEAFRLTTKNLYHTVRALFFLYAIYRFYIPKAKGCAAVEQIPYAAITHLRERRFEEAIQCLVSHQSSKDTSAPIASGLAACYHGLAFQKLSDQVRQSVKAAKGNQWMFRVGHPFDHPLRIVPQLQSIDPESGTLPILREQTAVRMDLSHSAWSDIFFLGMDFPDGARVINASIDLGVLGRDDTTIPPVEAYFRVIDQPVLRLTSVDLNTTITINDLRDVFDFAKDYLGLLKAAIIAAGIIPPGIEGAGQTLKATLERVAGKGNGIELVSNVNDIPKGSRLAVSTNLLGALIAVCMRATGQVQKLTGSLSETERRTVAARAILGEWLGGSGGGWQDSGGVWPGIKLIHGVKAEASDPEFGISRGCLLPKHEVLGESVIPKMARNQLQTSMVLVHGGMAQNVGPILEMVTEKYLLRSTNEWLARKEANQILDKVLTALAESDIPALAETTTKNFFGPIQSIIPWATNRYTELLVEQTRTKFGSKFLGFCMLGGMAGGGMAFFFDPEVQAQGQRFLKKTMQNLKNDLEKGLPFAMDPVVYQFKINDRGSTATLLSGRSSLMPNKYYNLVIPNLLRHENRSLSPHNRAELQAFARACRVTPVFEGALNSLFDRLLPDEHLQPNSGSGLAHRLESNGFDPIQHERIRSELKIGRIGLAQNRLPSSTSIENVIPTDLADWDSKKADTQTTQRGIEAIRNGEIAVVTLAAGVGSRWTAGAGTVKAVNPFSKFQDVHRTFIETHLAKSRHTSNQLGADIAHIFTTSYLTHEAIKSTLSLNNNFKYKGPIFLSEGRSIGLRMIPMARDLRYVWEEMSQQRLDEQKEKVRDSTRAALLQWAQDQGEGRDYTDNLASQCMHPIGHWYEFANLLRNGTLNRLIKSNPNLNYLYMHNVDTMGANLDPSLLGFHIEQNAALTFEVIPRWFDDQGGGLAKVNGRVRLLEGLAIPNEADEFKLSYYNTNSNWIHLDQLLALFDLTRSDLENEKRVTEAVREIANRLPTYVTLKEVKKRWGNGQEDIYPVTQFEKIWGDMTSLYELDCRYAVVSRQRGQQLKDPAQLDGWLRDGTAAYVDSLCSWT